MPGNRVSQPKKADDAATGFGRRLRRWRTERGLTLKEVGSRSGLSITYLSDLERGKLVNPTLETLTALAGALDVSLNELLGVSTSETQPPVLREPLLEFQRTDDFQRAISDLAEKWRMDRRELEQDWLDVLRCLRIGKRSPASTDDYRFLFDTIRRVLE